MKIEEKYSKCPVRHVLSLFSDKWSLLVLCNLHIGGSMRFGELATAMTDISERMLSVRLKNLERLKMIDSALSRKSRQEWNTRCRRLEKA